MKKRSTTKPRGSAHASQPWEKENPKAQGEHEHLTAQAKAAAKKRARAAGRPYPNLVDNMRASAASKK